MFPPRAERGYVVYHSSVPPSHRQLRSLLVSVWPQWYDYGGSWLAALWYKKYAPVIQYSNRA